MTSKTWTGTTGQITDTTWSDGVAPVSGDTAIINTGTVLATGLTLTGLTVVVQSAASTAGMFGLLSSTLASSSTLMVSNPNLPYGSGSAPTLTIQGTSTNNGTIDFTGTAAFVTISAASGSGSGTLVNNGTIAISDASPQFQAATNSAVAVLTNNGTISVTHPTSSTFQSPVFNATINGTGTIAVGTNAKLDLAGSVGSGQTLAFTGGAGAGAVVQVDSPASFNATISQFVSGDTITLTNTPYTSFAYSSTGANSGVLTLYNGATATANLVYSGEYSQSTFAVNFTDLGGGASTLAITTSVVNSATGATANSGTVGPVYRFFDTRYGTHFFTSDAGERNTVLATRPDLVEETNGFGDVAPTDPNAVAVYRFFDTTYGTHFFTASATERDTVIATRTDLSYEPNSTFYEHLTAQGGDVPVYRLFDQATGTQFLTGNQGEYTGITTPGSVTYRSDLRSEGVAFYAPTGSFT